MKDQDRIEMASDNCEVLRDRLAKYEDADGRPVSTVAELTKEIERIDAGAKKLAIYAVSLETELAMAKDAADKGDIARMSAGGMEQQIIELEQELAALKAPAPNHIHGVTKMADGEVVAYLSDFSMVSVRFGDRVRTYVETCAPNHSEQVRCREDWGVFASYLLDKCEGDTISEEVLQRALHSMFHDQHYGALFRGEKAPSAGSQGGDV